MNMKKLVLLMLLVGNFYSPKSQAAYYRFWVGYKKEDVTQDHFQNGLNSSFFGETIRVGKGKGLISYQPAILDGKGGKPSEVALVAYESVAKYNEIRNTPAGKAYGEMHWDYFDKTKSKSAVPEEFHGSLEDGHAYDLFPDFSSWKNAKTFVKVSKTKNIVSDSALVGHLVAVSGGYTIEFLAYPTDLAPDTRSMIDLQSISVGNRIIGINQGANFQF